MVVIEDRSRRKPMSWKAALVSASFALVYSTQEVTGFQTQSRSRPRTPEVPCFASKMGMDDAQSPARSSESRTWNNVKRPTGTARYNGKVGPILADSTPIHVTDVPVLVGQGRKKMMPMPVTGYDAQSILDFYDRRPLQVGWRLNSLGFPLLGWYLGLLSDKALGISEKPSVMRKRGVELRRHLVRSQSVALIKVSTNN
jgi:hypothetical protein